MGPIDRLPSDTLNRLLESGKVVDRNYAGILVNIPSLSHEEAIALDAVVSSGTPNDTVAGKLISKGMVERSDRGFRVLPVRGARVVQT